jgi:hypothetical protein
VTDDVAPDPIPVRELAHWLPLVPALLAVIYLVGLDQGALSQMGQAIHEFLHDGRHFLAVPCH